MTTVLPLSGQSNYDIALQVYGTLDMLVKLAVDNNIEDLSVLAPFYIYDETNSNIISNVIGFQYNTEYDKKVNICAVPTGFEILSSGGNSIIFRWNNPIGLFFQYSYNTTGDIPTNWTDTTASIITINGLIEGNTYYIFLRTKCNTELCSLPIMIVNSLYGDFNNDFNDDFNIQI